MINFIFPRHKFRPLVLALTLGVLAACSSADDNKVVQGEYACPEAGILGGAERITQFKPGKGRDLIDVMFEADIRSIKTGCKILEGRIVAEVSFELVATRGSAAESRQGKFIYFVAVADTTGRVLAKETFDTVIEFAENRRRAGTLELTEQSIPTTGGETAADFEILVGFQLSPEQLKFNRRK